VQLWLPRAPANSVVLTENSVGSENAEVAIVRAIMVATMMNSLFIALFAFVAFRFRIRGAPGGDFRPSAPTGRSPKRRAAQNPQQSGGDSTTGGEDETARYFLPENRFCSTSNPEGEPWAETNQE
jgi:hypothetical protein